MTVPDDRPSLAEDISALDRIIERLRWFDQGFGEGVLLRVLSILQQHERAMAALRELTEAVDAIPDHNIVSHTTFVIGVSSAQAIALGIKAMAALDDAASAAATPARKGDSNVE
jgi:hypothetical protein